jgi:hypothetical protein
MERKYRVWDGSKLWLPPKRSDTVWVLDRNGILWKKLTFVDGSRMERKPDAVPMFSTGYEDSEGNEIYDSDLVLVTNHQEAPAYLYLVEKSRVHSGWGLSLHGQLGGESMELSHVMADEDSQVKIVGNVYDRSQIQETLL